MPIDIRPVQPGEEYILADLSRRTFYETFASFNTKENMDLFMNGPFHPDTLIAELHNPLFEFYFCRLDNQPAGYVKLCLETTPELQNEPAVEIGRFYIDKPYIGKGIAAPVMQFCLERAQQLQKKWIWLGVWQQNYRAIRFYEKSGFSIFGEHVFWLGNDPQTDWLMKKPVPAPPLS